MKRALFLDRDGIFNELVPWGGNLAAPRCWEEVKLYEGMESIKSIKALGFLLILISNQPDIEREITEKRFVENVNSWLKIQYDLDDTYYCPYSSDDHPDKKPNPGMILHAARKHQIDLNRSFFIGDTERDIVAGQRAGVTPILWNRVYNQSTQCMTRINTLSELTRILIS
jgi:histidinol-phosphate phosphatase family protein